MSKQSLAFEAYEQQLDLLRWMSTDISRRFCDYFAKDNDLIVPGVSDGIALHSTLKGMLECAETYAVNADTVTLLEQAAQTMKGQAYLESDLPSDDGFVHLARPLKAVAARGDQFKVHALTWSKVPSHLADKFGVPHGIALTFWTDAEDAKEDMRIPQEIIPQLWLRVYTVALFGRPFQEADIRWEGKRTPTTEQALPSAIALLRFLPAFFAFVQQEIVAVTHAQPYRALARRAAREKLIPKIKVVTLRRRHSPEMELETDEHHGVAWSHRWIVNGFWRQQWYPSLGHHRQIWIDPYVKGPEDKPLVAKKSIYAVTR